LYFAADFLAVISSLMLGIPCSATGHICWQILWLILPKDSKCSGD